MYGGEFPACIGLSERDGGFFFMNIESDESLVVVSEFVFIVCNILNVDRSHRPRAGAIAHDLNQTRHLPINFQFDRRASGWDQS